MIRAMLSRFCEGSIVPTGHAICRLVRNLKGFTLLLELEPLREQYHASMSSSQLHILKLD
jgi:hypothetical protein